MKERYFTPVYNYSKKSKKQLATCHPKLQELFNEVIKEYDCTIIIGHRNKKKQDEAFRTGASKKEFPFSKHNSHPSIAADVAPYPIDWNNTKRFYHFAGYVQATADRMGIKIRWGGDWDSDNDLDDQTFMDLVHFELLV
jgi:hypothetical protein